MMGRTHIMIGLAGGMLIAGMQESIPFLESLPKSYEPLYLMGLAIGSLGPDIDHPKGLINAKLSLVKNGTSKAMFYGFLVVLCIVTFLYTMNTFFLTLIPFLLMVSISKHRGITHSLLSLLILSITYYILAPHIRSDVMLIGIIIGWALHIVADFFNPQGVELLYPCKKNMRFPITIRTNKTEEKAVQIFAGILVIYQGILAFV